jgi:Mg/Co/Ni transporter MgtE
LEDRFYTELEKKLSELKVSALMDRNFTSLTMKEFLPDALCQFVESGENHLPVIDKNGHLIGEVSSDSILRTMPVKEKELLYAY